MPVVEQRFAYGTPLALNPEEDEAIRSQSERRSMPKNKANPLITRLEQIGRAAAFALRVIRDAFRPPFELSYVMEELADQGW